MTTENRKGGHITPTLVVNLTDYWRRESNQRRDWTVDGSVNKGTLLLSGFG